MLEMTPEQAALVEGEFAKIIQEIKCPICLELLKTPRTGPCQHNFCEECIYEYIKDNHSECPTCRQPGVNKRSLHKNLTLNNLLGPLTIICDVWGVLNGAEPRAVQEEANVKEEEGEGEEEVWVQKKRRRGGADSGEASAPPTPARGKGRSRGRGGTRANSRRPRGRAAGKANVVEDEEHAVEGEAAGVGGSSTVEAVAPVVHAGHGTSPRTPAAPARPFQNPRPGAFAASPLGGEAHNDALSAGAAGAMRRHASEGGEAAGNDVGGPTHQNREGHARGDVASSKDDEATAQRREMVGDHISGASQGERSLRRDHDDDGNSSGTARDGHEGSGGGGGDGALGGRSYAEAESMYVVDFGMESLHIPSMPQTYEDESPGSVDLHAGAQSACQLNAGAMEGLLAARVEAGGVGGRRGSCSSTTTRGSTHGVQPAQGGAAASVGGRGGHAASSSAAFRPHGEEGPREPGGIGGKVVTPPGGAREVEDVVSGARTVVQQGGQHTKRKRTKPWEWCESHPQAEDMEYDDDEEEVQGGPSEAMPSPRRLSLDSSTPANGALRKHESSSSSRKESRSCRLRPMQPIITTTGFEFPEKGVLQNMATAMGAIVKESWDRTVTHVVCNTDASGAASKRTLKYCLGLLSGARLVKAEWLRECSRTGRAATPCDDFEVSGCKCLMVDTSIGVKRHEMHVLPPFEERRRQALGGDAALLSPARIGGKRFYVHGSHFEGFGSSRADLLQLLELSGGVLKEGLPRGQDLRYAIVLCSDGSQRERVAAWRAGGANVLSTRFVMDSVTLFGAAQDLRQYDV